MRRFAVLVATAALAMGVAACGAGSKANNESGLTGEVKEFKDASNPDLAPVKVGVIGTIGTASADHSDRVAALRAGASALNARGGLNGHRVEVVFCNDKDDPNQGVRCARQMVEEKVVAITGMAGGTITAESVYPVLEKAGTPLVGIDSPNPRVWNGKNAYLVAPVSPLNYQALIAYAVKNDLLPMAVAAGDNPAGLQFADFLEDTLKKLTGGEGFAKVVKVAADTADYAPIAGALKNSGAKSVLNIISPPLQLGLIRALDGAGSDAVLLTATPLSFEQLSGAGPGAGRLVIAGGLPPFDDPSMKRFRDEMASAEAAGNEDASLDKASPYASYSWVGLQVLEQVTKGMETITAQSVGKALDEAKDIDLGGIIPPWTPSEPGPEGYSRISNTATWFATFDSGKVVALADGAVSQEDLMAGNFQAQLPPSNR